MVNALSTEDAAEAILRYMQAQEPFVDCNLVALRNSFAMGGGDQAAFERGLDYAVDFGWIVEGPNHQFMLTGAGLAYANRFLATAGRMI
jgi:hypothetical protein